MPTVTVLHATTANGQESTGDGSWLPVGTANNGAAVAGTDGLYTTFTGASGFDETTNTPKFVDDSSVPAAGITITSVTVHVLQSLVAPSTECEVRLNIVRPSPFALSGDKAYDQNQLDSTRSHLAAGSTEHYTKTYTTNPVTSAAWQRSEIFDYGVSTIAFNYNSGFINSTDYHVDQVYIEVTYTVSAQWWTHPTYGWFRYQAGNPSLDAEPTDPAPSSLGWLWNTWTTTTAPVSSGWWFSDSDYGGAATLIAGGRPAQPRLYTEIVAFATGSTAMLGGSPGAGCVFNNHLVYAKGGYTVGTDYPTIRVWDGTFDRQLAIVPPTSAGAVPKGVMSFLAANGTIYVSTLDSGTDSSTYTGRVFELDFESGTLSQVGTVFPTGHVPYSLAWYNGQLFCGTHRRTPTAAGRIYKFRTDFSDSTWVLDRDLTSDSLGGVTSMLSFQGTLFVGTDANTATFAKVLARDYAGTYTTSDTGSGGAAVANNGFLSMVEFGGNLYAGYWNNDATAITKIRKYNGASWSTAYTGAAGTLRPLIGFVVDDGYIFAIGGGLSLSAIVLRSSDGASWTDLTAQVTSASSFTAVPVFGVIVL